VSNYKYILIDEFGGAVRKFANKLEAQPYLTHGTSLVRLPKQPDPYELVTLILEESPF
jgi:hypothetical protein